MLKKPGQSPRSVTLEDKVAVFLKNLGPSSNEQWLKNGFMLCAWVYARRIYNLYLAHDPLDDAPLALLRPLSYDSFSLDVQKGSYEEAVRWEAPESFLEVTSSYDHQGSLHELDTLLIRTTTDRSGKLQSTVLARQARLSEGVLSAGSYRDNSRNVVRAPFASIEYSLEPDCVSVFVKGVRKHLFEAPLRSRTGEQQFDEICALLSDRSG